MQSINFSTMLITRIKGDGNLVSFHFPGNIMFAFFLIFFISGLRAQSSDPYGLCDGYITNIDLSNTIPNPSFDNFTCCPTTFSQMDCAVGWNQASTPTPDYMHTCGFIFPAAYDAGLVPFPSGGGIAGAIFAAGWQEYISSCLDQPIMPGIPLRMTMQIAYTPITNMGGSCSPGNHGPIDIVIFGSPNCNNLVLNTNGCPSAVEPSWRVIGSATYNPVMSWQLLTIELEVDEPISAFMIGSPCNLPPEYSLSGCFPYFYFDDLRLIDVLFDHEIDLFTLGHPCSEDYRIIASIDTTGGEWHWYVDGNELVGENTNVLNISQNGYPSGTYFARYVVDGFCVVNEIEIDLTISDAPEPTCPSFISVCITDDAFDLPFGSPAGGTFSGPGVSGGTFTPALAGGGLHQIIYTAYSVNNCPGTCEFYIDVQELTPLICPYDVTLCGFELVLPLEGGFPEGGEYTGPGVTFAGFDPEVAGYGIHEITYTYRQDVCDLFCTFTINVLDLPLLPCPPSRTICMVDGDQPLQIPGFPGTIFTGPGVDNNIFSPEQAGLGTHTINGRYMDVSFCDIFCSLEITVSDGDKTICPSNMVICSAADSVRLSGAVPAGGIYFGPGVYDNFFYPDSVSVGVHELWYTIPNSACKDTCSFEIEIIGERPAVCPVLANRCIDGTPIDIGAAQPDGGIYSAPGLLGNQIFPDLAGAGIHTLQYRLLDSAGCIFTCTQLFQIFPLPMVTFQATDPICVREASVSPGSATPAGGFFTGIGISGSLFNPNVAGAGTHLITYTFVDANQCSSSASDEIQVDAFFSAGADIQLQCFRADTAYLEAQGNGSWRIDGSSTGTANIMQSGDNPQARIFDFSVPGTYMLIWQPERSICADTLIILVDDDCRCIVRNNFISTGQTTFCYQADGILLSGPVPDPPGGTYTWEWSTDGVNFISAPGTNTTQNYTTGTLVPGIYFFRRVYETAVPEECYSLSNTIRIEIFRQNTAGVANTPVEICQGDVRTVLLSDLIDAEDAGGVWTEVSSQPSQGSAFDSVNGRFSSEGQISGIYVFKYSVPSNGICPPDSVLVEVRINPVPVATIVVNPSEVLNCVVVGIQLSGPVGSRLGYEWSLNNTIISSNRIVEVDESGTYRLRVFNLDTGCESFAAVLIGDERDYPIVIIDQPDTLTCSITEITVNAGNSQTNTNIVHEWFNSAGVRIQTGGLQLRISIAGTYTLVATDTVNLCSNSQTIVVAENTVEPLVNAGEDQTLYCNRTQTSLQGSASSNSGQIQLQWVARQGTVVNGGSSLNPSVNGAGWYILRAVDPNNGCSSEDSILVRVTDETFVISQAEGDTICKGASNGRIRISSAGEPPLSYTINGVDYGTNGRFENLPAGTYRIIITDALGCRADTVVFIREHERMFLNLPARLVIEQGDSIMLLPEITAAGGFPLQFEWFPDADLFCSTCDATLAWPEQNITYLLRITDAYGCNVEDMVEILVKRKIRVFIPGAFTPNGDGINDSFTIFSPDVSEILQLELFDRWGNRVFEKRNFPPNDPEQGWSGNFRNQEMDPAVFAYVAKVILHTGEVLYYHGEVQLIR
jgi:gliding motility-associated-like protein